MARLTHHGLAIMLPWPIAIGYRRFRQGLLIRRRLTRLVTYGTAVRLAAMSAVALAAARVPGLQGVHVGTIALATGVVVEAVASRIMTRGVVAELQAGPSHPAAAGFGHASPTAADSSAATSRAADSGHAGPADASPAATDVRASRPVDALTMPAIFRFYLPLAMTSLLAMAVQPAVTFFVGQSRFALESLAVLPVIHGLTFLFRALGLSFQEVGIALFGDRWEQYRPIRNFGWMLAAFAAGGLGVIVFTPLAAVWFEGRVGPLARAGGVRAAAGADPGPAPGRVGMDLLPARGARPRPADGADHVGGDSRGRGGRRAAHRHHAGAVVGRRGGGGDRDRGRAARRGPVPAPLHREGRAPADSRAGAVVRPRRRRVGGPVSHSAGDATARSTTERTFLGRSRARAARRPSSDIFPPRLAEHPGEGLLVVLGREAGEIVLDEDQADHVLEELHVGGRPSAAPCAAATPPAPRRRRRSPRRAG